jgi:predicted nucleotidyltransferase
MLRFPFLLDPAAKTRILQYAAQLQMEEEAKNSIVMSLQGHVVSPFLVLNIRRERIVEDALNQVRIFSEIFFFNWGGRVFPGEVIVHTDLKIALYTTC